MKLQKIIERLQKLHPKKIDLNLDRIQNLCKKLGSPQKNLNCISVIGTNGNLCGYNSLQGISVKEKLINLEKHYEDSLITE